MFLIIEGVVNCNFYFIFGFFMVCDSEVMGMILIWYLLVFFFVKNNRLFGLFLGFYWMLW